MLPLSFLSLCGWCFPILLWCGASFPSLFCLVVLFLSFLLYLVVLFHTLSPPSSFCWHCSTPSSLKAAFPSLLWMMVQSSPHSFEWCCFHLPALRGGFVPPFFDMKLNITSVTKVGKVRSGQVMWWSPLLLLGGAVSPSFLWEGAAFSFSSSFGKVLLSSFLLLFCLALLLPFVLGGSLSTPPSSWVVLPSSSSFWEGAAFSLPLLPGIAASLPPWRLPFSSSSSLFSPSSLDWCCSGASALDFSFGSVFSNGF